MIVDTYWGQPSLTGSLCHLREYINRLTVDRKAKTFSIADKFVRHTFRAHVLAAICDQLHIQSPSDPVAHDPTLEWLEKTATSIVDTEIFRLVVRKNLKSTDACAEIPSVFRTLGCQEHH